ncbi:hypothetical protein TWF694_011491 [Orbilia ellipsospora]|uniref:Aminoglycoside phosphotransferase domain-containing protein n=1 Tax=Orbilia ellipsospora TaxID=2528407 RepID=A0AAV9X803_9PEZI
MASFVAHQDQTGEDKTPLEKFTQLYKEAKKLIPNFPPIDDFKAVQSWLNAVELTEEENVTETDLFPADTASTTSTNYYGQEAFRTYQPKLFKLLAGIVPLGVSIDTVGRMKGGGNNRTASIGLDWPAGMRLKLNGKTIFEPRQEDSEVKAVFRAPRWLPPGGEDRDIIDNFAVLTYLGKVGLKVPAVFAYDSTSDNAIGVPFMLMTRIPGFRLEDIYQTLTHQQKIRVAMLVAKELLLFDAVRCEAMGVLKGGKHDVPPSLGFMEDIPSLAFHISPFTVGRRTKMPIKLSKSPYVNIKRMIDAQIMLSNSPGPGDDWEIFEAYKYCFTTLSVILEVMRVRRFFDAGSREGISLHHPDFFARNIIIGSSCRRADNLTFEIEGVIDWDESLALPASLRSSPCAWLWELNGPQSSNIPVWEEWYGDSDELPSSRFDYRLSPDERSIKDAFDNALGEYKRSFMYKMEYVWLRRLWKFALHGVGFHNENDVNRFKNFIDRWTEYAEGTNKMFTDPEAKYFDTFDGRVLDMVIEILEREAEPHQCDHEVHACADEFASEVTG